MRTSYVIPEARAIADLQELEDGSWLITRVNVPASSRGEGIGSRLLRMILDDADREGVTLVLGISPSGGLNFEELYDWYGRHGFMDVPGAPRGSMGRLPCSSYS